MSVIQLAPVAPSKGGHSVTQIPVIMARTTAVTDRSRFRPGRWRILPAVVCLFSVLGWLDLSPSSVFL